VTFQRNHDAVVRDECLIKCRKFDRRPECPLNGLNRITDSLGAWPEHGHPTGFHFTAELLITTIQKTNGKRLFLRHWGTTPA
jgi:hypothetical protein